MKYFAIIPFITILFFSCNNTGNDASGSLSENEYLIEGTIVNAGGQPVFLDRLSFKGNTVVDTAIIANDGSFTMKGNIPEKGLYLIRVSNEKNWLIVLDKGKLTFQSDADNIYTYDVDGSTAAKVCANFIITAGENQRELNAMNQQFNQARMTGDMQQIVTIQQEYQEKFLAAQEYLRTFIDTTQHLLVAAFAANLLNVEDNIDFLEKFIAKGEQQIPNSIYIADLKAKVQQQAGLTVGRDAPDFELKSPKGKTLPLSGVKGKVVLLDFWASWCRPCRRENPNLVRLYEKYKDKGFEVYSVSLDKNMQRWVKAIEEDNLTWDYHGSNLNGWQCPVAQMYKVSSIPNAFLLDKEGKIIAKNLRGPALENKLRDIFGS